MIRFLLVGCFVFVMGCSKSDRLPTFKTTGTVKYEDGELIKEGTILFVAEGLPSGRGIIRDGKYEIGTYEETDGAVAADFRVGITVNPPEDYDPDAGRLRGVAKAKYSRPDTSGLEFTVEDADENTFDVELERGR